MKFTEGGFKKWGYELAEKFADQTFTWNQYDAIKAEQGEEARNKAQSDALAGKILVKDSIADIFLQQILTRPTEFDVVATMNLNGDYISDALAAQLVVSVSLQELTLTMLLAMRSSKLLTVQLQNMLV